VHRQRRRHHAATGVRDAHQLQGPLHGAVLAATAVQGDEHALKTFFLQRVQVALGRIERMRIHACRLQRGEHRLARHQGHLALGGRTTEQHRNLSETRAHTASSMLASLPGTAPMLPAPMVITTSPSRAAERIILGMSAMSSTNTGSTVPATRIARASERPSAATTGVSPAAYTSASSRPSTDDSTLTKSSKQSRVRV